MKRAQRPNEQVTVHVKGKNVIVTPALHDQVVRKMGKLDKYLDRLQDIEVELRTEHTRASAHHNCVEATTRVLGRTIRVTATHEDMHAAIDATVDKLYRQLNRQKERLKSHQASRLVDVLPTGGPEGGPGEEAPGEEPAADSPGAGGIRVERLEMKPQFEEEAVEEMEAAGRDFYVFLNARSERVNVLYRHSDGGYALIEPLVG